MGSILRENGLEIGLIDCLKERDEKRGEDGRAPFVKERVSNPEAARFVGKRFRRYGFSREETRAKLGAMAPPDLVLVTGIMTYWYQGVLEVVELVRETFPSSKIVVGGVYASLCHEHAERHMAMADLIVGKGGLEEFYAFVEESFGKKLKTRPAGDDINRMPYPAFDLYETRHFVPLITSIGCAYRCTYCATSFLRPRVVRRTPKSVLEEMGHWLELGVSRFALYDDSFLLAATDFARPLLRGIAALPMKPAIYNPNALNASLIDGEIAALLRRAGFQEIRLGLETIEPALQRETGGKVDRKTFERAVKALLGAGFLRGEIRAYVLAGLPLRRWEEVKQTIDYGAGLGIKVSLAEYAPIPHTEMFERYKGLARYPIAEEPLFQNNALFPFAWEGFGEGDMNRLKAYVRAKNRE
jgi:radical SAM superfamily enzyme YgiQ (UPF0313 family)